MLVAVARPALQAQFEGENIVGRDPRHPIWLDHPTVSRVHAAIVVRDSQVSVEDRSSKHGTFVEELQISASHPLADGDIIRFGGTASPSAAQTR